MTTDNFQWNEEAAIEFANYWRNNYPDYSTKEMLKAAAEKFKESKQRKPILVTEDGKPQFESDRPWYVTEKYHLGGAADLVNNKAHHPASNYKYFSTQEIAENYIIENKPCLSLKEIKHYSHLSVIEEQQLLELIKLKL